ncbi:hypothetical protein CRI94_13225 [Longibacter salinarum]|uniref:Uncharacterized protein n=1 Tax=Longibacter salinarum TaxID=1850348 RepID=A0A2A8CW74_9BACT|nr:hypothetical protein [Longibacter salinarum]PEN12955.1 hypothetical protein CRI94_13225 [Longibacter salinarum]
MLCVVPALVVSLGLLISGFLTLTVPSIGDRDQVARDTTDSTEANQNSGGRPWHDAAWNQIVAVNGVQISYIYYAEANELDDGIVVRLQNTSGISVRVAFTIIFRSPDGEVSDRFATTLAPYEMKTGDNDDLYWIPFTGGQSIGEVGLRGVDVERIAPPPG